MRDLRQLHQSFVLPVLTYCLGAWGAHLSPTSTTKLESCTLQACRAITGLLRSTPADFVHKEARVPYFETTRKRAVLNCYEKSLHLPHSNPRRSVIDKKIATRLPNKRSCRSTGDAEFKVNNLAKVRRRSQLRPWPAPPWLPSATKIVNSIEGDLSKAASSELLRQATISTIRSHGAQHLTFYTDGSAAEGIREGGCGVVMTDGDPADPNVIESFSFPGPSICSSFDAECLTMKHCIEIINNLQHHQPTSNNDNSILICSDSQSVLSKLSSCSNKADDVIASIQSELHQAKSDESSRYNGYQDIVTSRAMRPQTRPPGVVP